MQKNNEQNEYGGEFPATREMEMKRECKLNVGYSESKSGSNNCGSEKSPMTLPPLTPVVKRRQCAHLVRVEHLQER